MPSPLPRWLATTGLILIGTSSCQTPEQATPERPADAQLDPQSERASPTEAATWPERALAQDWTEGDPYGFEQWLARELPSSGVRWSEAAREQLSEALERQDATSVRAAVLLAHDPTQAVTECLIAQLERRLRAPSRALDAGDLLAAAALEGRLEQDQARARVRALVLSAANQAAHPDLEVRIECACVLLAAGEDAVIPFLLRVLRVMTPDEELDPPDWEPVRTLYWAKHRAAQALSQRAGVPLQFLPDASYEDQAAQAAQLARALEARAAHGS